MGIVKFNVFDRITGDNVKEGICGFYNSTDTFKLIFNSETMYKKLPAGNYKIYVGSLSSLGITTKEIQIRNNTKVEINFFLGSILQW